MALNPDQYRLSEEEHQAIFDNIIKPDLFADVKSSTQPIAIIFGGQPGAGKSAAVDEAMCELSRRGGALQIIGDDLRTYHPLHYKLMEQDDKTAAFYTDRDAGRWIEKTIDYAKEKKVNLVIEGTMRDSNKVAKTMQDLRAAGYEIDARVLAVNHELSELGILQRYEKQIFYRGQGRMTTKEAHQASYDGMLTTIARIEHEKLADRMTIYRRGADIIYSNEVKEGRWINDPTARITVENERNRPFSPTEVKGIILGYEKVLKLQETRNASQIEKDFTLKKIIYWAKGLLQAELPPVIETISGKDLQDWINAKVKDLSVLVNSPERAANLLKLEKEKVFQKPDSLKDTNVVDMVEGVISNLKANGNKLKGLEDVEFKVSKTDLYRTLNSKDFQQQISQAQKLEQSKYRDMER